MDLHIEYNNSHYIVEIKLVRWYQTPDVVRKKGLQQIRVYRDRIGVGIPSYLVIFDRRPETKQKPWEDRILWGRDEEVNVLSC
jgi:hypothetical protein